MLELMALLAGTAALGALMDGTSQDDTLTGDDTDNTLNGRAGDDLITGAGGDDLLRGGTGDDVITGDMWDAGLSNGGDDRLIGGAGDDMLFGQAGSDVINAGKGADLLDGGLGNDVLRGGAGDDELLGRDGDDSLFGGRGADLAEGGAGDDLIRGQGGADTLTGGFGDDLLFGGAAADLLVQQADDDGYDTLVGNGGDDTILSLTETGTVDMDGGAGDDLLVAAADGAYMVGGNGSDAFGLYEGGQDMSIADFDPADDVLVVYYPEGADPSSMSVVTYPVDDDSEATEVRIVMNGMDDMTIYLQGVTPDEVADLEVVAQSSSVVDAMVPQFSDGGDGPDTGQTIQGTNGADTLTGTDGDDVILGLDSGDSIDGGAGADFITNGNDVLDDQRQGLGTTIVNEGTPGQQTIPVVTNPGNLRLDPDEIEGGAGDDTIVGGGHDMNAYGGEGADLLVSNAEGISDLFGGAGDDILVSRGGDIALKGKTDVRITGTPWVTGHADKSAMYGGDGDDTLVLSAASLAYGGAGADTFIANGDSGSNTSLVYNFDFNEDNLVLTYDDTAGPAPTLEDVTFTSSSNESAFGFYPYSFPLPIFSISAGSGVASVDMALPIGEGSTNAYDYVYSNTFQSSLESMIADGRVSFMAESEVEALQLAEAAEARAASLTATT